MRYLIPLRDPVERCISAWHFAAATRDRNPIWAACEALGFDLERILRTPWSYEFRNDQTRYLAGVDDNDIVERHFEDALAVVRDQQHLVGPVDQLAEILARLPGASYTRGASVIPRLNSAPRTTGREPVDIRAHFAEANKWDLQLYEAALSADGW